MSIHLTHTPPPSIGPVSTDQVTVQAAEHRAPVTVAPRPSGLAGGLIGAFAGGVVIPIPFVGLVVGAVVGRKLQRNHISKQLCFF